MEVLLNTEPVAEWYERLRFDHSEAVWAGSNPATAELLVLGKKSSLGLWHLSGI